jgi:hypothetical protein
MDPRSKFAKDMALNNLNPIEQTIQRLKDQLAKLEKKPEPEVKQEVKEEFFTVKEVD